MTTASRFRVEQSGSESVRAKGLGEWYVVRQRETDDTWLIARNTRPEKEYLLLTGEWSTMNWHDDTKHGWYKTEAEARYRLLLYQSPREALAAFYKATGGEYVGTCGECVGSGTVVVCHGQGEHGDLEQESCGECSGTGGSPDSSTLLIAADWFEEHGMRDGSGST